MHIFFKTLDDSRDVQIIKNDNIDLTKVVFPNHLYLNSSGYNSIDDTIDLLNKFKSSVLTLIKVGVNIRDLKEFEYLEKISNRVQEVHLRIYPNQGEPRNKIYKINKRSVTKKLDI